MSVNDENKRSSTCGAHVPLVTWLLLWAWPLLKNMVVRESDDVIKGRFEARCEWSDCPEVALLVTTVRRTKKCASDSSHLTSLSLEPSIGHGNIRFRHLQPSATDALTVYLDGNPFQSHSGIECIGLCDDSGRCPATHQSLSQLSEETMEM